MFMIKNLFFNSKFGFNRISFLLYFFYKKKTLLNKNLLYFPKKKSLNMFTQLYKNVKEWLIWENYIKFYNKKKYILFSLNISQQNL